MIKHLICEGIDGSGKTTLIGAIKRQFMVGSYPRFSDSKTGPHDHLAKKVEDSFTSLANAPMSYILDRHPLISELIYGPVLRGHPVDTHFLDLEWVNAYRQGLMKKYVVIFCVPPIKKVWVNIVASGDNQMPSVLENIDALYTSYLSLATAWSGPSFIYNYTKSVHVPQLRRFLISEGIK